MTALRHLRLDLRMTQADLAKKSGVSRKQINLIESGQVTPQDATVFALSRALRVEPSVIDRIVAGEAEPQDAVA